MKFRWAICAVLAGAMSAWMMSASAANPPAASAPSGPPQTPGHHNLVWDTRLENKPIKMSYALFLPKNYEKNPGPRPMVVFLCGAGEGGTDPELLYVHGPQGELKRNKELADWADFVVLSPQCPPGYRWDNPAARRLVLDMIRQVQKLWKIDATRIYLTGLSMGGVGTWETALDSPGTFAAIAPISAIEYEPQKMAQAMKTTTVWIICGTEDGDYTKGSRNMYKTLRDAKVDAHYSEVPGDGHSTWSRFYPHREFYEFLLSNRKGAKPTTRPGDDELLAIGFKKPGSMDEKLEPEFHKFLQYWTLYNCGSDGAPGLKDEFRGKKNVFATCPLDATTAARIMTSFGVAKGKKTALDLVVGHHPEGDWQLVVRIDGKDVLSKLVGKDACKDGWLELSVDLTSYAGKDIRVELLNQPTGHGNQAGYWAKVDVNSP